MACFIQFIWVVAVQNHAGSTRVADNTSPALQVTIKQHQINDVTVAQILVPEAKRLVATKEGAYLRRRLKHDDTPECIHIPSSDEPLPR